MVGRIAETLGYDESQVAATIDEFVLQLHKSSYEYVGPNGDFIGEKLRWEIPKQGYYHFLSFLDWFADRYSWDRNSSFEYLARLGSRADWTPFIHQTEKWVQGRPLPNGDTELNESESARSKSDGA